MDKQTPEVATLDTVLSREGYFSLEPVVRPSWWGVDLDWARRPGVPMMREPQLMANARTDIEPMRSEPAAPKHGRPNKRMPPVYGTATPLQGIAGAIRKFAYSMPDHKPTHWLLNLFADRVDSMSYHAKKYAPFAVPLVGAFVFARSRGRRKEDLPEQRTRIRVEAQEEELH